MDQYDEMIENHADVKRAKLHAHTERLVIVCICAFAMFVTDNACSSVKHAKDEDRAKAQGYQQCVEELESVTVQCGAVTIRSE